MKTDIDTIETTNVQNLGQAHLNFIREICCFLTYYQQCVLLFQLDSNGRNTGRLKNRRDYLKKGWLKAYTHCSRGDNATPCHTIARNTQNSGLLIDTNCYDKTFHVRKFVAVHEYSMKSLERNKVYSFEILNGIYF